MCPANTCGIFLFTLPVRAATSCGDYSHNFYSRHPYGRLPPAAIIRTLFLFTPPTRAATTKNKNEVLRRREKYLPWASQFLFTPPMRAATLHLCGSQFPTISIHATRTGSDMIGFFPAPYPFLFTPPTWAATIARIIRDYNISIHATRTGGDFLLTPT